MKKTVLAVLVSLAASGAAQADIHQAIDLVDNMNNKSISFDEAKSAWATLDAVTQKQARQYDKSQGTNYTSDFKDGEHTYYARGTATATYVDNTTPVYSGQSQRPATLLPANTMEPGITKESNPAGKPTHQDDVYIMRAERDADAAVSRLNSMQPDYNAVVVAAHNANAIDAAKKAIVARQEQARAQAEADHITQTVMEAHDANAQIVKNKIEAHHLIAQREADAAASRLDSMKVDYNAVVVATHDVEAANVAGKLKAAANVTRTAGQQVIPEQAAADARLNSMKPDYNAVVVATHDIEAANVAGKLKAAANVARTASQQVIPEQAAADTRLNSMQPDYNAVVVATHDIEAANVAGKLKTAANVARTASQQVIPEQAAADTRLNSMAVDPNAEVVAAHDAQAYEVAQGVARKADNANRTSIQHVDGNAVAIADNTMDIAANTAGVAANKAGVEQTTAKLDAVTYDIAGNRRAISGLATRAADTDARIAETKAEQAKTNERVSANSAAIADHENRIESLESETTSKFSSLKNKVEENRKRASAGIAGVAAMANIPQVTDTQNFSVGAGVGNTDSESALAVGMSARATENVVVKTSVSNDTQHNFVVGAGVSYGW
ncbi:YadA-like family protein [Leclercia sp. H6W5]|uniref:YadA-like family protein n=1 Tax=Leclercia tamurae TaxID=2926467 RepID=UPI0021D28BBF|nr:YadA-like family protein [Leclercia tamurae]MCU6682452.1 YadA-like family protein [Leclercia tamurae]